MLPLRKSLRRRLSSTSPSVYSGDSDSDEDEEDEEPKVIKKVEEKYPVSMMRIIKLNGKEWPYILLGSIAAIIMGASLPTFAIIFGEYFEVKQHVICHQRTIKFNYLFINIDHDHRR